MLIGKNCSLKYRKFICTKNALIPASIRMLIILKFRVFHITVRIRKYPHPHCVFSVKPNPYHTFNVTHTFTQTGVAVRTKTRTCTNPAPAFGGRVCVGQDRSEELCTELLPCPTQAIDGEWGIWSPWSECSVNCGVGYRFRERKCNNPAPSNGGQYCKGNNNEFELCNEDPCNEQKKIHITEWVADRNTTSSFYHRKRFKIICKAPVKHPNLLKVVVRDEEQYCHSENTCDAEQREFGDWGAWTEWSSCSVKCGSGVQTRTRYCKTRTNCAGESVQTRICYGINCNQNEWGCWSQWSACNISCGWGFRTRTRKCLGQDCEGSAIEEHPCQGQECESKYNEMRAIFR